MNMASVSYFFYITFGALPIGLVAYFCVKLEKGVFLPPYFLINIGSVIPNLREEMYHTPIHGEIHVFLRSLLH